MELATQLRDEAVSLVPLMQKTVDPSSARTLVGTKTHPNFELAAAGLGLHRGQFKNPTQAMRVIKKAFAGSISAATQKTPKKAKDWQSSFARYDELMATVYASTQPQEPAHNPSTDTPVAPVAAAAEPRAMRWSWRL